MLIINYPVPTKVKHYVFLHFAFGPNLEFPALLYPAPLIYHQWIPSNSPYVFSFGSIV